MTNSWVRLWHDMPTDPKWRVIAKRSGRSIAEVIAVFTMMLTNASANANERGRTQNWSDEDAAAALDIETEHVAAIREAMQGKILEGDKLSGWEKRQPKREDGAAERAKEWRERKRTQTNAQERSYPEPDKDKDKDLLHSTSEQEPARESEVKAIVESVGLGRGGSVSAEARRKVAAKLNIADADPLVRIYEAWSGSSKAIDPDGLFISTAARMFREASAEVKVACKPLTAEPIPIAARIARPSSSLIASLSGGSHHGLRRN